jgi:hypothetical protein
MRPPPISINGCAWWFSCHANCAEKPKENDLGPGQHAHKRKPISKITKAKRASRISKVVTCMRSWVQHIVRQKKKIAFFWLGVAVHSCSPNYVADRSKRFESSKPTCQNGNIMSKGGRVLSNKVGALGSFPNTAKWMDGWMDGWMDEWINKWIKDLFCISTILILQSPLFISKFLALFIYLFVCLFIRIDIGNWTQAHTLLLLKLYSQLILFFSKWNLLPSSLRGINHIYVKVFVRQLYFFISSPGILYWQCCTACCLY